MSADQVQNDRGMKLLHAGVTDRILRSAKDDRGSPRMSADQVQNDRGMKLLHAGVTDRILRVFYEVYNELGGGFLESVYHAAFALALRQEGLRVAIEVAVPVYFRGVVVGDFRADLTVNDAVLIELKAIAASDRVHEGQILNYLRATKFEVGLLLNFGPKPQIKRMVLENGNKQIRVNPRSSAVGSLEGQA